ncbi:alpha/beta hydrolase [Bacteriovorax sp. Seq25_V]|uniref:alpha/beta hydrolase n=1 Tax=Bacteriovorax sp. Seq25_V TaxID=1201288 RepID=UPI00038A2241|nr:phospholipase/carboxylesterase [Bacteriovorax sp. Seq25_V]EQC43824.1 phospholipase/carboxylesterase [Bacteriovorax sp. Seq25_V]
MIEKCKRILVPAESVVDFLEFGNPHAKKLLLILHGYGQNAQEIYESLKDIITDEYHCIIPNGVFPMPKQRADKISYRFAWYFYNTIEQKYYIDFKYPCSVLSSFLARINPENRLTTIVGYSQGGYLSPFLGQVYAPTRRVIGINCNYRYDMLNSQIDFDLFSIHSEGDPIVNFENSQSSFEMLRPLLLKGEFIALPTKTHDIDQEIRETLLRLL